MMFASFKTANRSKAKISALAALYLTACALFVACVPTAEAQTIFGNHQPQSYGSFGQATVPSQQGRTPLNVTLAVVLDIQDSQIEVEASSSTTTTGSALGGVLGAVLTSGRDWQTQAAGAVVGGILGNKIAEKTSKEMRPAKEIIFMTKDGRTLSIVQEMNGNPVGVGDVVYMVGQYPAVRIVKAPQQVASNKPVTTN